MKGGVIVQVTRVMVIQLTLSNEQKILQYNK